MKKTLGTILSALSLLSASAQINLQNGYIVTLTNDTIRGQIDYRTENRNSQVCTFVREGENTGRDYQPGEIREYCIFPVNEHYVSLQTSLEGQALTCFGQRLVQGELTLYSVTVGNNQDIYIFQPVNGEPVAYDAYHEKNILQESNSARRRYLSPVLALLSADPSASERLWKGTTGRDDMIDLVRQYNHENTSSSRNVRDHSAKVHNFWSGLHWIIRAGIAKESVHAIDKPAHFGKPTNYNFHLSSVAPTFGLGASYQFVRYDRGLYADAMLSYTQVNAGSDDIGQFQTDVPSYGPTSLKLSGGILDLSVGAQYRLGRSWRIQPMVLGGGCLSSGIDIDYDGSYFNADFSVSDFSTNQKNNWFRTFRTMCDDTRAGYNIGYYFGAGCAILLPVGTLLLTAEYKHYNSPLRLSPLMLQLSYEF